MWFHPTWILLILKTLNIHVDNRINGSEKKELEKKVAQAGFEPVHAFDIA